MPTNASINPYKSLFLQSKGSPCFHVVTFVLIAILAGEFSPRGWTSSIYWLVDIPMSFLVGNIRLKGILPAPNGTGIFAEKKGIQAEWNIYYIATLGIEYLQ